MKHFIRTFVCLLLAFSSNSSYASHIVGADLYYTHISDSTYKISIALYGDCGASSSAALSLLPTATPRICLYDGSLSDTTLYLAIDTPTAGVEITNACSGAFVTQCTDISSTLPGIKRFTYSRVYTLSHNSANWQFKFFGDLTTTTAGRAAAITNLTNAGSTTMCLTASLNSILGNSSPSLTVSQQSYFCLNNPQTYGPAAIDSDGDNLLIHLTPGVNASTPSSCTGSAAPVTYWGAYTATSPLSCTAGTFGFDTLSGIMNFSADILQRGIIAYTIEERRSGILVGTSQREMTVLIITCAGGPCGSSSATNEVSNDKTISIYPNPTTNELKIDLNINDYNEVTITNTIGTTLFNQPIVAAHTAISTSRLPAGIYYISLKGRATAKMRKIIVMH